MIILSRFLNRWFEIMAPQSTVDTKPSSEGANTEPNRSFDTFSVNIAYSSSYCEVCTSSRSMPIQFCPEFWLCKEYTEQRSQDSMIGTAYKIPRIQMLAHFLRSVSGRMMAGSFPPSSRVTGVRCLVAAIATLRPTSSEPMNVMCLIKGEVVRASACSGQQHTTYATYEDGKDRK